MYFLINDEDNSVNCYSAEPLPDFMAHTGLSKKELPVDHLPEDTNYYDCFWDQETNTIKPGLVERISHDEFKAWIDQQQVIQQAITQQEQGKWNTLLAHIASKFPDDPKITEILSDGVVTDTELQQIEDMLNGSK
jgi:hypothetical protein